MTREEAEALIHNSELSANADAIIEELQPSVQINATRVAMDELPIRVSRMGGVPDLPDDFTWPTWVGSRWEWNEQKKRAFLSEPKEKKLHFIAQLNMDELRQFQIPGVLPPKGTLYFFYDLDMQPWGYDQKTRLGSRVIYCENDGELRRSSQQPEKTDFEVFPCKLSFSQDWTIPSWGQYGFEHEEGLELIEELQQELVGASESDFPAIHRLFGWPETIQNDMRLECQLVANGLYCGDESGYEDPRAKALIGGAQDWILLLQVDTDEENPGWMWGDTGRIYYWIRKHDLANRRFENARLILQCS